MIQTGNRDLDIHTAERVIKKVLNPGVETAKIIDKFGLPLPSPHDSGIPPHQSYVLSPRGVPTKVSSHLPVNIQTHAYKFEMMPPNYHRKSEYNVIQRAHTMASFGTSTARPAQNIATVSKKRAISSSPVRPMQQYRGLVRERHLSSVPLDSKNLISLDHWNISPQGIRLEKEWSAVSKCRAIKRTSEIVNHRIDQMYFMSGSQIKLQSRYHVDDDELRRLRDLSRTRQTSRQHRLRGDVYTGLSTSAVNRTFLTQKTELSEAGREFLPNLSSLNGLESSQQDGNEDVSRSKDAKSPLSGWTQPDGRRASGASESGPMRNTQCSSLHGETTAAEVAGGGDANDKEQKNGATPVIAEAVLGKINGSMHSKDSNDIDTIERKHFIGEGTENKNESLDVNAETDNLNQNSTTKFDGKS